MTEPARSSLSISTIGVDRPTNKGKFLFVGDIKLYVRGVTYGTFCPRWEGQEYPSQATVHRDFALMAASGINAVRTYTVPPRWLLDAAYQNGLYVMVGMPLERYIGTINNTSDSSAVDDTVRASMRLCRGHPAILCYVLGNELPASVVRWYGKTRIERYLERLYRVAKSEDPDSLVTYVNYPSTEYLNLPFLDLVCFNVYLESPERFDAYLARLQNIAGERPLLMSELGLDSRRNGDDQQAKSLDWQIRTAYRAGCAGAFVYAWTDEWYAGGREILDWDFGLTKRDRSPKPALQAVSSAYAESPFPDNRDWPSISVVVCSYNGSRMIRQCLASLEELAYSNYEIIVIDDGSTDSTAAIAHEFCCRVITTEHLGLSNARNAGLEAASGEIVAYIDDDAYADPHWLHYLASEFMATTHAGVGGPNISPAGDGPISECVASAPGNPTHVLLTDSLAEHIPGCNMAFRKQCLVDVGGFDTQFRIAGDDVDICWRIQERGWSLGYTPAAMVWHHRRSSVRAYWRQQRNYGKAEAMLAVKWPEKYNAGGHLAWNGHVYDRARTSLTNASGRIYHGVWGLAPFQYMYNPARVTLGMLPLIPEWYLICLALLLIGLLGLVWPPLQMALPMALLAAGTSVVTAGIGGASAVFPYKPYSATRSLERQLITAYLYALQPLARLVGRLQMGLTPWRLYCSRGYYTPFPRSVAYWVENRQELAQWLHRIEGRIKRGGAVVRRGGDFERWDLEVHCGTLGAYRIIMALEEHSERKQLLRFRTWPAVSRSIVALAIIATAVGAFAALDHAWIVTLVSGALALLLVVRMLTSCAAAAYESLQAIDECVAAQKGNVLA